MRIVRGIATGKNEEESVRETRDRHKPDKPWRAHKGNCRCRSSPIVVDHTETVMTSIRCLAVIMGPYRDQFSNMLDVWHVGQGYKGAYLLVKLWNGYRREHKIRLVPNSLQSQEVWMHGHNGRRFQGLI
ncbi:hypothetical protein Desti_3447 [Desulfomonile tiedjei DSM 6799]|uniref:Uncharacterized protein n=1 Tax=Desulfomonile tiedjei (strain ATCC 49306 / DSM 6799 / DCB-1) TaxID=706587 RepID=I4C958_DESTA|nr:hypothetical protein Desti_3447 [Desulfomonile tiedjei DSM 6799]